MDLQVRTLRPRERIYKTITLHASRGRVWLALSDPEEFGRWFGATIERFPLPGPFEPGMKVTGIVKPNAVDPELAEVQRRFAGLPMTLAIVRVDPVHLISFRWHPFAFEPGIDYRSEPTTLVELQLENDPEGVVLTVTESGFHRLSPARRATAFEAHDLGWEKQLELLKRYVERS